MNDPNLSLDIIIQNREGILLKEKAYSLTSLNDKGVFDILPHHANFISLIQKYIIVRNTSGEVKEIKINGGTLVVEREVVKIYLDVFEKPPGDNANSQK